MTVLCYILWRHYSPLYIRSATVAWSGMLNWAKEEGLQHSTVLKQFEF